MFTDRYPACAETCFYLTTCLYCRQLADVTRDGALSLEEFFTAMHLVVLRRNNIELPESLPPSLFPQMQVRWNMSIFMCSSQHEIRTFWLLSQLLWKRILVQLPFAIANIFLLFFLN